MAAPGIGCAPGLKMDKPDWSRDGRDWPNRGSSRFVRAAGLQWHVQVMGSGPPILLLHGAGAASHSWRDVAPKLARRFTAVALDLPGHGFTDSPGPEGLSLDGMVRGLREVLDQLQMRPVMAVGHSAGAAIAIQLRLEGRIGAGGVVSINGALKPFPGAAGQIFPALAKLLFLNPMAIQFFAWRARRPGVVGRLLESTGSRIDEIGLRCYARLLGTTGHVAGALGMMANWDLKPLADRFVGLPQPLILIAADNDHAVPPEVALAVRSMAPESTLVRLPGLGHLAHEEAPDRIAEIVIRAASRALALGDLPSGERSGLV
jgi:magnesium chelatase accessory protein